MGPSLPPGAHLLGNTQGSPSPSPPTPQAGQARLLPHGSPEEVPGKTGDLGPLTRLPDCTWQEPQVVRLAAWPPCR